MSSHTRISYSKLLKKQLIMMMEEFQTAAAHSQKHGHLVFLAILWRTVVHSLTAFVTSNMAKYNMPVIKTRNFGSADAKWGGLFVLEAAVAVDKTTRLHASQQSFVYEMSPEMSLPTSLWRPGIRISLVKVVPPLIVSLLTSVQNINISCHLWNFNLACKCLNMTVAWYQQTCQRKCRGWAW